jgi:hypothetical protein
VPARSSFDYAIIRVVPRVERGEMINAGVILFCLEHDFLGARVEVNEARIRTLWPATDLDLIRRHLQAISRICAGDPAAGPIARLSLRERFRWLVAPRSTMIQISPVHAGLCVSTPERALDELFQRLVAVPTGPGAQE